MASPRRARSLFLPPDKAELLIAREFRDLSNGVTYQVPRRSVPRQPKPERADKLETPADSGDESGVSATSTIRAVDTFCRNYRPPSVTLKPLSYLNKELPPPPPPESPTEDLGQSTSSEAHRLTRTHVPGRSLIPAHSRYSTRTSALASNRLSAVSSLRHGSDQTFVTAPSRYSSRDPTPLRTNQRRSEVAEQSRECSEEQGRGSVPDSVTTPEQVGEENQAPEMPDSAEDSWTIPRALVHEPLGNVKPRDGQELVAKNTTKRIDVGFNFWDGFTIKTINTFVTATQTSPDAKAKSTRMIPIGWTFHDGLILRTNDGLGSNANMSPINQDSALEVRSKRVLSIGWSFYGGLIIRTADGSKTVSKMSSEGESLTPEAKSKSIIPVGWSFHDGFIFRTNDSIKDSLEAANRSGGSVPETNSNSMIPIGWNFHDGFIFGPAGSAKDTPKAARQNEDVAMTGSKSIIPSEWTSHGGSTFKPDDLISPGRKDIAVEPKSNGIPICFNFWDGLTVRSNADHSISRKSVNDRDLAPRVRARRSYGWTFHDGLYLKASSNDSSIVFNTTAKRKYGWTFQDGLHKKRSPNNGGIATRTKSRNMPIGFTFYHGLYLKRSRRRASKGKAIALNRHQSLSSTKARSIKRISFNFWDGVRFATVDDPGGKGRIVDEIGQSSVPRTTSLPKNVSVQRNMNVQSKPAVSRMGSRRIAFNFWDGVTIRTNGLNYRVMIRTKDGDETRVISPTRSKRIAFNFWDGVAIKTNDLLDDQISTPAKSRRVAFNFWDGVTIKTNGVDNKITIQTKDGVESQVVSPDASKKIRFNFWDGVTFTFDGGPQTSERAFSDASKQRSLLIESGKAVPTNSRSAAPVTRRSDIAIDNEKAVPNAPRPQVVAIKRPDLLAGCFWGPDGQLDDIR